MGIRFLERFPFMIQENATPRVSLLFEHSNKNQVALKIFAKVSIHDSGELFVFSIA